MAAFEGFASVEDNPIAGAATETVLQLVAATNHRVKVIGFGISFEGTKTNQDPIKVVLKRQTTAGTSAASTRVVKADDSIPETLQTTARDLFTVEPTGGDELYPVKVHPQGWYEKLFPEGKEVIIGGGDRLGIEITTQAGVNPNVDAFFHFEE